MSNLVNSGQFWPITGSLLSTLVNSGHLVYLQRLDMTVNFGHFLYRIRLCIGQNVGIGGLRIIYKKDKFKAAH